MPEPGALAFVDTETTGLNPVFHTAWEVAVIRRDPNGRETEYLWQIRPNATELLCATPEALRIGRYHERFTVPDGAVAADMLASGGPTPLSRDAAVYAITQALQDAVLVGSNPHFDAMFLYRLLGTSQVPWHYRPVDIATLAAGHQAVTTGVMPVVPFSSRGLSRAVGVEPPGKDTAHTALGDARWARSVFDAVASRTVAVLPLSRAALRDCVAKALIRWAEGNNSPQYAFARRPETVVQNNYSRADAVLAALLELGQGATESRTPCSDPPCGDGLLCDEHEEEKHHAEGQHEYCGPRCETVFPTDLLRNTILHSALPGAKNMLAELERRAAAGHVAIEANAS
ncbi:3'-5' exonuclease [Streptomyces sp. NPDC003656]